MKKILLIVAAALCCAAVVVSCNKPSNGGSANTGDKTESTTEGNKIAKSIIRYKFVTSEDMMEYFDFKVVWWDPIQKKEGVVEKMTLSVDKETGKKTSVLQDYEVQLPCRMAISVTATIKEGAEDALRAKGDEKIGYLRPRVYARIFFFDAAGTLIDSQGSWGTEEPDDAMGAKASTILSEYEKGGFNSEHYADIDANGVPSNFK